MKTVEDILNEYGKEIKYPAELTLEKLITSHRVLRNLQTQNLKKFLEEVEEAKSCARKMVLDSKYVLKSDLKKMTLNEIVYLLAELEDNNNVS